MFVSPETKIASTSWKSETSSFNDATPASFAPEFFSQSAADRKEIQQGITKAFISHGK